MAKLPASPHAVAVDSAPLLPVRRLPTGVTRSATTEASRHVVLCPMVGTEVVLQRCNFCPHGREWIHDQATDRLMLRCTYLAQQS